MHGNVLEWCNDWYDYYPNQPITNPKGATAGKYRVLRGGSWINFARLTRSARRNYSAPYFRNYDFGFRLALGQKSQ
jgi:formylglycine-generating enzyme